MRLREGWIFCKNDKYLVGTGNRTFIRRFSACRMVIIWIMRYRHHICLLASFISALVDTVLHDWTVPSQCHVEVDRSFHSGHCPSRWKCRNHWWQYQVIFNICHTFQTSQIITRQQLALILVWKAMGYCFTLSSTKCNDYTLITNLMHCLLFIRKILLSSTCFEHQVLIFRST